jgi:glycosyltransferase involved in cell wall biosynthesis
MTYAVMRRVLIVTGSYAPTMIADMHRARQLAWCLPALGWNVEILCPNESFQPSSCLDDDSAAFFAADTPVHGVPEHLAWLFHALNIGSIGMRAILPVWRAGQRLLGKKRYDLVYISTAQFLLFLLGPAWYRQFGIPYVLDLHDPVYRQDATPPAGLKHRMSRSLSKLVEAKAAKSATGLISVSPRYLDQMHRRYANSKPVWLASGRQAVIPFAVLPRDLEEAARALPPRNSKRPAKIIYVGTGGPLMIRSFSLVCRALSHLRERRADLLEGVRIELYGTASALGGDIDCHLAAIAHEQGLTDVVSEAARRVTYRRSLELLLQAEGALILGVDDAGYMPSKLFTYAYSGKPILASLHRACPALSAFQQSPDLGHALWFGDEKEMPVAEAANIVGIFLDEVIGRRQFDRHACLEPYSADVMAQRHAAVFEACLR